jgi:hypothetical protein
VNVFDGIISLKLTSLLLLLFLLLAWQGKALQGYNSGVLQKTPTMAPSSTLSRAEKLAAKLEAATKSNTQLQFQSIINKNLGEQQ